MPKILADGLCPHGRHEGAVCTLCDSEEFDMGVFYPPYPSLADLLGKLEPENTGLNASYYDLDTEYFREEDGTIKITAQKIIEYLNLNFSQGNQLKSLIRENNPNGKKETSRLYEAEKRYYYAERDLRCVQKEEDSRG